MFDYDELDEEYSEIDKELEEKLWEIYDRIKKQNQNHSNFAKSLEKLIASLPKLVE